MNSLENRVTQLEKQQPAPAPARQLSDDERIARIKVLAVSIARKARAQGVTAKDDPTLGWALAIAEVLEAQP